jgi:acyl-CoA reductase-like NAD-dependent aldehyde dehydrogenase
MSTERIIVHSALFDSFTAALKQCTEEVFPSSATSPVLVSAAEANKTRASSALRSGASIVSGDPSESYEESLSTRIRPIILKDVSKDTDLYHNESFGPSVVLFKFDTEVEALAIANDIELHPGDKSEQWIRFRNADG